VLAFKLRARLENLVVRIHYWASNSEQSRAEPTRRLVTGGIVIMLGAPTQRLPAETVVPAIEMEPAEE
jgi:hypothetical protein